MLNPKTAVNVNFGQPVVNQWMQAEIKARITAKISSGR
jgi:hypothetical protein